MHIRSAISLFAFSLLFLTGCATKTQMAFGDDAERMSEKSKPVLLMTATIKNTYKPTWQPRLIVVNVEKPNAQSSDERLNFTMDEKAKLETNSATQGNTYLIRMELDPGNYELKGLSSLANSFPINGFFFAPLHMPLTVSGTGVSYLGHVNATVRERVGNEFKAGASVPLIDQAVTGASGGTFDIEITDDFGKDESVFRSKFPALAKVEIKKSILPAFDRAKAQKFWEAN